MASPIVPAYSTLGPRVTIFTMNNRRGEWFKMERTAGIDRTLSALRLPQVHAKFGEESRRRVQMAKRLNEAKFQELVNASRSEVTKHAGDVLAELYQGMLKLPRSACPTERPPALRRIIRHKWTRRAGIIAALMCDCRVAISWSSPCGILVGSGRLLDPCPAFGRLSTTVGKRVPHSAQHYACQISYSS